MYSTIIIRGPQGDARGLSNDNLNNTIARLGRSTLAYIIVLLFNMQYRALIGGKRSFNYCAMGIINRNRGRGIRG